MSTAFNYFSNKEEGYNYLILPASYFEKWLSVVVLLVVLLLFYCLFFRILDTCYINYLRHHLIDPLNSEAKMRFYTSVKTLPFWRDNGQMSLPFPNFAFFTFFNITALMAIGGLYFNKMALIKTLFASIGLYILLYYLSYTIGTMLFQTDVTPSPINMGTMFLTSTDEVLILPHPMFFFYNVFFSFILPIIFWLIALIRLREKEI